MSKNIHYIVTSDAVDYAPTHIYAPNRKEAARLFVEEAENPYGYGPDSFDGYYVLVVLNSDIECFGINYKEPEPLPPPKPKLTITRKGKGA